MKFTTRLTTAVLALTVLAPIGAATARSAAAASCTLPTFGPGKSYHPQIDPSRFGPNVDNPWFPLTLGKINVYVGTKDGKRAINVVAPSPRTRVVDGVTTRIVEDRLYLNDVLEEKTADYYAQDD